MTDSSSRPSQTRPPVGKAKDINAPWSTLHALAKRRTWQPYALTWLCIWCSSLEDRHLTKSPSSAVIPAWMALKNASADSNKISRSNSVLHMNLTGWVEPSLCIVRRLIRTIETHLLLQTQHTYNLWEVRGMSLTAWSIARSPCSHSPWKVKKPSDGLRIKTKSGYLR